MFCQSIVVFFRTDDLSVDLVLGSARSGDAAHVSREKDDSMISASVSTPEVVVALRFAKPSISTRATLTFFCSSTLCLFYLCRQPAPRLS